MTGPSNGAGERSWRNGALAPLHCQHVALDTPSELRRLQKAHDDLVHRDVCERARDQSVRALAKKDVHARGTSQLLEDCANGLLVQIQRHRSVRKRDRADALSVRQTG